jgi:hypothetical protein
MLYCELYLPCLIPYSIDYHSLIMAQSFSMIKLLRIVLVLLALLAIGFVGMRFYTKSFSPSDTADFSHNGLEINVDYCQPAKKGRLIFGPQNSKHSFLMVNGGVLVPMRPLSSLLTKMYLFRANPQSWKLYLVYDSRKRRLDNYC